jgi:hypothetical protein
MNMSIEKLYKDEVRHQVMNSLMNLRWILQCKFAKVMGRKLSKRIAIAMTRALEIPFKIMLY